MQEGLSNKLGMSQPAAPLPWARGCGPKLFVQGGSREGRAGDGAGGPGRARGPRTRSKANLEACRLAGYALRATPAFTRLRQNEKKEAALAVTATVSYSTTSISFEEAK